MRDPRRDWQDYPADQIPTKESIPDSLYAILQREGARKILDLGCGTGRLAVDLAKSGYIVMGVDINEAAIQAARARAENAFLDTCLPPPRFLVGDATRLALEDAPFDAILLQLLISIIGTAEDRKRLIHQTSLLLKPGGILYLSASGVSDEINPKYADLYGRDLPLTGEKYSYLSKDPETGKVLYMTHHFSQVELEELLERDFDIEILKKEREVSSRRPTEPAYFFYIVAWRKFT